MERETIERALEQLESIKSRPKMFFGSVNDVEATIHFFHGYHAALFYVVKDNRPNLDDYHKIHLKRGWRISPIGVAPQMKEKGMSKETIVQELITIEIEAWKMLLEMEANN